MILTLEQEELIVEAGLLLKKALPNENLQFCFNLSREHNNVNYNIKQSGIIKSLRSKNETVR